MEDTIWFWNDWREVEFRSGGKFFAPDADNCHDGTTCTWHITDNGRKVVIRWGTAGEHTVSLSSDRQSMKGQRFDGDPCHGEFRRRDLAAGRKRHKKQREESGSDEDDGTQLYDVLELDSIDATEQQIKKQFRRLSRKYHPDKNRNDPNAAAKFEQIREAYEVIGNPDKRTLDDTGGIEAVRDAEKEDASGGGGGMDPFAAFFGGGGGGGGQQAALSEPTVSSDSSGCAPPCTLSFRCFNSNNNFFIPDADSAALTSVAAACCSAASLSMRICLRSCSRLACGNCGQLPAHASVRSNILSTWTACCVKTSCSRGFTN